MAKRENGHTEQQRDSFTDCRSGAAGWSRAHGERSADLSEKAAWGMHTSPEQNGKFGRLKASPCLSHKCRTRKHVGPENHVGPETHVGPEHHVGPELPM